MNTIIYGVVISLAVLHKEVLYSTFSNIHLRLEGMDQTSVSKTHHGRVL